MNPLGDRNRHRWLTRGSSLRDDYLMKQLSVKLAKLTRNFFLLAFLCAPFAKASELSDFLTTCGYGTLGGAALGAVSLAFVEDPSSKVGNIARGASLGLYAGIGWGLYQYYSPGRDQKDESRVYVVPVGATGGAGLMYTKRF